MARAEPAGSRADRTPGGYLPLTKGRAGLQEPSPSTYTPRFLFFWEFFIQAGRGRCGVHPSLWRRFFSQSRESLAIQSSALASVLKPVMCSSCPFG